MKNGDKSVPDFYRDFKAVYEQLAAMGHHVDDLDKLHYRVGSLTWLGPSRSKSGPIVVSLGLNRNKYMGFSFNFEHVWAWASCFEHDSLVVELYIANIYRCQYNEKKR